MEHEINLIAHTFFSFFLFFSLALDSGFDETDANPEEVFSIFLFKSFSIN